MPANVRETKIAFGFKKQSALQTAQIAADMWSLTKVNANLANVELVSESDALDIGKGDEFASQNFLTNWNVQIPIEKFLSSEIACWAFVFCLGKFTKTSPVGSSFQYVCTPQDPVVDGIELPAFTMVETIRQGASDVLDRALVGNVIEDFTIMFSSGPGRQNAKISLNAVGCGKQVTPSTITVPAVTTEHALNASGVGVTINGVDYVTAKNMVSVEFGFKNNLRLDSGFYPGSGSQNGASIRGRMEFGNREAYLRFVARFENGSLELDKLIAQTEGTAVITAQGALISGATYHSINATFHRTVNKAAVVGDTDGIVTVAVECQALKHSSNGLLTFTGICAQDDIGA